MNKEKCCNQEPTYKFKNIKGKHTFKCKVCGMFIGGYGDFEYIRSLWNNYHQNKRYIETWKKINDEKVFIPLEVKR